MLRTTTLVWCSLALTLPVLLWQALSAESVESFQRHVSVGQMDNESSLLLAVGGILIAASSVAGRMLRKPSPQNGPQSSGSSHGAVRTPSN